MKTTKRELSRLVNIALLFLAFALPLETVSADTEIISPNDRASTEGNSGSSTPFGNSGPIRYQQVFDASQFSAISQGGAWIDAVLFRADGAAIHGFAATVSNLQINLSSTTKVPDGLSTLFAENVGTDDKIVFGPGLSILEAPHSSTSPQLFLAQVSFSTPFFYDPSRGNLLMDIRNYSGDAFGGGIGSLDGEFTTGDSVSSNVGLVNSDSAFSTYSFGLITEFGVMPVPEPSSVALFVGGCAVFGCAICRRRKKDQIRLVSFAENNKRTEAGCDKICENEL